MNIGGKVRLTGFGISGHSRLGDMTVEIRDHLVIVGANDVGKTSVFRLLNNLLGATVQQLYQSLSLADLRASDETLVVTARLEKFTQAESGLFPFEMTVEDGAENYLEIRLEVRTSPEDPENVVIDRFFPGSGNRRSPSRDQLAAIGWRYLPANRTNSGDYMVGKNSPFRSMLESTNIGGELGDLGALLEQFNEKLESNEALAELRRKIAAHLSRSVPRTYDEAALSIRTTADPLDQPLQDVSIFIKEGEILKSLADQSDGMRQLLALTFFDLAQASANIVAVDEPELHLHASSQRTVASLFADSDQQRLVVTHSPYIVQRFEPKHVLVINPSSQALQIPETNFSAVEKEMLQWWSPQLLEGMTAQRLLFVEGLADRIVVEAAAAAVGINLDRFGVSVFALDGADKFKHVLKVVGKHGFNLPICGLCDEDRKDSWATILGFRPKDLGQNGFFIASIDLEHEYVRAIGSAAVSKALISGGVAREQGITQACGVSELSAVTDAQLARFITSQDSRKVPAARAVAAILTSDHVKASPPLSGLLAFVSSPKPEVHDAK
jgi:putative ATP-dependent endonuclease of OLD family